MDYVDFHLHRPAPDGVRGLVSSPARIAVPYFSLQVLPDMAEGDIEKTVAGLNLDGAVALGEVGLDRRLAVPMARQIEFLTALLDRFGGGVPVVIHCVRAYPELNGVLKNRPNRVLLHRFTGSPEEYRRQRDAGRLVSQSPREFAVRHLDDFVLESDADADAPFDYAAFYRLAAGRYGVDVELLTERMNRRFDEFTGVKKTENV